MWLQLRNFIIESESCKSYNFNLIIGVLNNYFFWSKTLPFNKYYSNYLPQVLLLERSCFFMQRKKKSLQQETTKHCAIVEGEILGSNPGLGCFLSFHFSFPFLSFISLFLHFFFILQSFLPSIFSSPHLFHSFFSFCPPIYSTLFLLTLFIVIMQIN